MEASFPEPGEIFAEKYRVQSVLGSGGFSRIYHAIQQDLERDVALKILRPVIDASLEGTHRSEYLSRISGRFQQEARLVSRLRCPYTITMYDYGRTEEGLLYMVLEYIDGQSLAEILREGVALEQGRVVKILRQVLESLHEAHSLGMLHRDLKPANIMVYEYLGEPDQVKLLDFGIAKQLQEAAPETEPDWTTDGVIVGTPRYMSPEQLRNDRELNASSDLYSLGLVAFELLTGTKAITTNNKLQIIVRQVSGASFVLPPNVAMAPGLRAIVNKMLCKDMTGRFSSAQEVLAELENLELSGELDLMAEVAQEIEALPVVEVMTYQEEVLDDAGILQIEEVEDIDSFEDAFEDVLVDVQADAAEEKDEEEVDDAVKKKASEGGVLARLWSLVAGAVVVILVLALLGWRFGQFSR